MASMESRRRLSDQQWQQLFARFEISAQTVQAFCQAEGLSVSNFYRRRSSVAEASANGDARGTNRGRPLVASAINGGGFIDLGCLSSDAPTPPAPKINTSTLSVCIELGGGLVLQIERT